MTKIEQLEKHAVELGMTKEEIREFAQRVLGPITVVTMYRADDAEFFCQLVHGQLTDKQRKQWRHAHGIGQDEDDEKNEMFFRTLKPLPNDKVSGLFNVDGEHEPVVCDQ